MVPNIADLPAASSPDGKEVVTPLSRDWWRSWLDSNPDRIEGVWVAFLREKSPLDGPQYPELVEEALCFGWIDSTVKVYDEHRRIQWFSPRRRGGIWSALTKERLARLEDKGLMTDRGRAAIEAAKADGSWTSYDPVEALIVPEDLRAALESEGLTSAFGGLSASMRKGHLWAVYSAKRPETRSKRIASILDELR